MGESRLTIKGQDLTDLRVVVCANCKHCTLSNCAKSMMPLESHIQGRPCPLGKHPDANGWIRWLGVRWIGLPMPVRWWLSLVNWNRFYIDTPGCGCALWLKRLWIKVRAYLWAE